MGFFILFGGFALLLLGIWYHRRRQKLRYTPAQAPPPPAAAAASPDAAVMACLAQKGAVSTVQECLPGLFDRLVRHPEDTALVGSAAAAARAVCEALTPSQLLHLGCIPAMRPFDWEHFDPGIWESACAPESYRSLLCLGTMHGSGYLRERCLRPLLGEPEALPYILVRLNDWVPEIRRLAGSTLRYLIPDAPISLLLDCQVLFEKLLRSKRCKQDESFRPWELYPALVRRWEQEPEAVLSAPLPVRNLCYGALLVEYRVHTKTDTAPYDGLVHTFLAAEPNKRLRSSLQIMYLRFCSGKIPEERLLPLLSSRDGIVRQHAAARRIRQDGVWDGFEELLIDPYRQLREMTAFFLKRAGFDCLGYVRRRLPEPGAVLAVGELGTAEEIPLIALYLASDRTRAEALISLTRLGADDAAAHVFAALSGADKRAARTAFRLVQSKGFRYAPSELFAAYERSEDPTLRRRLLLLLCRQGGWDAVPFLLELYARQHLLHERIALALSRRNLYLRVPAALACEIRRKAEEHAGVLPQEMTGPLLSDLRLVESA
ncbi:MAG: hypothetical protein IJ055_02325 [Oscillospiraceae bacterium]|nr:hypothetical protein [Oscillospiraceae bacterium]